MNIDQSGPYGGVRTGIDQFGRPIRQTYMNQQDADRLQEWRSIAAQRMAHAGRVRMPEAQGFDYSAYMRGGTGSRKPVGQARTRLEESGAPAAGYNVQAQPTIYQGPLRNTPTGSGPMAEPVPATNGSGSLGGGMMKPYRG